MRWEDERELGGRAYFALTSEPPALVLNTARRGDQGQFTCRVEYLRSPSTFVRVNLSVISKWRTRNVCLAPRQSQTDTPVFSPSE